MDPLSIAAGIAGFISLTTSILAVFDRLPRDREIAAKVALVRQETDDIQLIATSIDSVLEEYERHLEGTKSQELETCEKVRKLVKDCHVICTTLAEQLNDKCPIPDSRHTEGIIIPRPRSSRPWKRIVSPILSTTFQALSAKKSSLNVMLITLNVQLQRMIWRKFADIQPPRYEDSEYRAAGTSDNSRQRTPPDSTPKTRASVINEYEQRARNRYGNTQILEQPGNSSEEVQYEDEHSVSNQAEEYNEEEVSAAEPSRKPSTQARRKKKTRPEQTHESGNKRPNDEGNRDMPEPWSNELFRQIAADAINSRLKKRAAKEASAELQPIFEKWILEDRKLLALACAYANCTESADELRRMFAGTVRDRADVLVKRWLKNSRRQGEGWETTTNEEGVDDD